MPVLTLQFVPHPLPRFRNKIKPRLNRVNVIIVFFFRCCLTHLMTLFPDTKKRKLELNQMKIRKKSREQSECYNRLLLSWARKTLNKQQFDMAVYKVMSWKRASCSWTGQAIKALCVPNYTVWEYLRMVGPNMEVF